MSDKHTGFQWQSEQRPLSRSQTGDKSASISHRYCPENRYSLLKLPQRRHHINLWRFLQGHAQESGSQGR